MIMNKQEVSLAKDLGHHLMGVSSQNKLFEFEQYGGKLKNPPVTIDEKFLNTCFVHDGSMIKVFIDWQNIPIINNLSKIIFCEPIISLDKSGRTGNWEPNRLTKNEAICVLNLVHEAPRFINAIRTHFVTEKEIA